ncbi:MAG: hypothetical protein Aureis2KO_10500 [Aureisphaera sp.]
MVSDVFDIVSDLDTWVVGSVAMGVILHQTYTVTGKNHSLKASFSEKYVKIRSRHFAS